MSTAKWLKYKDGAEVLSKGLSVGILMSFSILLTLYFTHLVTTRLSISFAGNFFFFQNVAIFLSVVVRFGLENSIIKFGANLEKNNLDYLSVVVKKSLMLFFFSSLALIPLILSLCFFFGYQIFFNHLDFKTFLYFVIFVPFHGLVVIFSQAFRAKGLVSLYVIFLNLLINFIACIFISFSTINRSEDVALIYLGATISVAFISAFIWFFVNRKNINETKEITEYAELLEVSIPLWWSMIASQAILSMVPFLLGALGQKESVAFFNVCQKISLLPTFILIAINAYLAPKVASLFRSGKIENIKNLVQWSTLLMTFFGAISIIAIFYFNNFILSFFGEEYRGHKLLLFILLIGQFFNVASGSVGLILSMTGGEKIVRNNSFICAILITFLGLILIETVGVIGAAIATSVAISFQNLIGFICVKKHLGFYPIRLSLKSSFTGST